jgi:hypothetical protein
VERSETDRKCVNIVDIDAEIEGRFVGTAKSEKCMSSSSGWWVGAKEMSGICLIQLLEDMLKVDWRS